MEEKIKIKLVLGTLASALIFLSFVLFMVFSVSTESVVLYPMSFIGNFMSVSSISGAQEAMLSSIIDPIFFLSPFIPIILAFCVLVFYSLHYGEDKNFCMAVCLVSSLSGSLVSGFSVTSLFLISAMVVCGFVLPPLAIIYLKELKKWKKYRIGSRTVGKCFLLINVFLFFAVFANVYINLEDYNAAYRQEAQELVLNLLPKIGEGEIPQIEGMELLPPEQQEQMRQEYSNLTQSQKEEMDQRVNEMFQSGNISSMINISLLFAPLMVFAILEVARLLVFSPLAGLVTGLIFRKIES